MLEELNQQQLAARASRLGTQRRCHQFGYISYEVPAATEVVTTKLDETIERAACCTRPFPRIFR
jgi:hypothetical protein